MKATFTILSFMCCCLVYSQNFTSNLSLRGGLVGSDVNPPEYYANADEFNTLKLSGGASLRYTQIFRKNELFIGVGFFYRRPLNVINFVFGNPPVYSGITTFAAYPSEPKDEGFVEGVSVNVPKSNWFSHELGYSRRFTLKDELEVSIGGSIQADYLLNLEQTIIKPIDFDEITRDFLEASSGGAFGGGYWEPLGFRQYAISLKPQVSLMYKFENWEKLSVGLDIAGMIGMTTVFQTRINYYKLSDNSRWNGFMSNIVLGYRLN